MRYYAWKVEDFLTYKSMYTHRHIYRERQTDRQMDRHTHTRTALMMALMEKVPQDSSVLRLMIFKSSALHLLSFKFGHSKFLKIPVGDC